MWININNNNSINKPKDIVINNITYPKSIFNDPSKLNELGIYELSKDDLPDRRYYTYTESINYTSKNIDIVQTERPIQEVKDRILMSISKSFKQLSKRPTVDTGLGYSVDCGIDDIKRLEIGRELRVPVIVDTTGDAHSASTNEYDQVILKMKQRGLELYQEKWTKEAFVSNMTTLQELIDYEHTPVTYIAEVLDDNLNPVLDSNENPITEQRTKYINKSTTWS